MNANTRDDIDLKQVQEYYDDNHTIQECLEKFGFSYNAWTRRVKWGLLKRNHARSFGRHGEIRRGRVRIGKDFSPIGKRYGMLVVLSREPNGKRGQSMWLCQCDCGNKVVYSFGGLNGGQKTACGCQKWKTGNESSNWRGHGEISSRYWENLCRGAKRRSVSMNITIEEANSLYIAQGGVCAISGVKMSNEPKKHTASLDRIDSSKGYEIGNIQWVHRIINIMKNSLSEEDFFKWVEIVYKHKNKTT